MIGRVKHKQPLRKVSMRFRTVRRVLAPLAIVNVLLPNWSNKCTLNYENMVFSTKNAIIPSLNIPTILPTIVLKRKQTSAHAK